MSHKPIQLTGEPKTPLQKLKTKANVDHVGLSLLLEPWKDYMQ